MRFLFVTFDGGGNMVPQLGLGRELEARGHSVTFLGGGRERVESRGSAHLGYSEQSDRVEIAASGGAAAAADELESLVGRTG